MKSNLKIIIIILLSLSFIFVLMDFSPYKAVHKSGSGKIVFKHEMAGKNLIVLRVYRTDKSVFEEIKILIGDKNIWNLIEAEKYYNVAWIERKGMPAMLSQIFKNDQYEEIEKSLANTEP